jgi:hypothetical protein
LPKSWRLLLWASACLLLFGPVGGFAQRGYPRIETVYPGAVTRGETAEILLRGRYNLKQASRVLFDGEGITATILDWSQLEIAKPAQNKLPEFPPETLRIKVTVADDAMPGIHTFRILTKGSLSAIAHLLVTESPSVNESEPNDSASEAQTIQIPQTVNGLLDKEVDFDVYKFDVEAGERVSFIVHAARLQRPVPHLERDFTDLVISLRDRDDVELAAADDWNGQDPQLFHIFEQAGTYYLRLREARYHSGKDKWWYALSVVTTPYVTSVFPPAARPGSTARLELQGFNLEGAGPYEVAVPADAGEDFTFQVTSSRGKSNPVSLLVTDLATATEPDGQPEFTEISIPAGISGRISAEGEIDRYRFRARKGDTLEFGVQRGNASLDPLLELRDINGTLLAAYDDGVRTLGQGARGELAFPADKNARIEWRAPADGQYEVQVRDANYFGGTDHVYHLIARPQEPDFALIVDDDRMPAGPGESYTSVVTIERRNGFDGPVELFARGLPAGVLFEKSIIPSHLNQGNIVLTGSLDAVPDAQNVEVYGVASVRLSGGQTKTIQRTAEPFAPMGQAGGRSFYHVPSLTAAVVEGSDIIMEATPRQVTLRPGESATVEIKVTRNNYDGPIEMNVILWNLTQRLSELPAGVIYEEKQSKTSLGPNETEGRVTFRVEADAPPLDDYLMTVLGQITYNRIFMTRVAAFFRLTIKPDAQRLSEAE